MKFKKYIVLLALCLGVLTPAFAQIQAGKSVQISVLGVPSDEKGRIDATYPVSDNGTVNMPFIGIVQAAGMKPENLATTLESRYKNAKIYTNPTFQVVANVEGAGLNEALVHVGGQVGRAGPVKFTRGLTLWQAIQSAGGPTAFGTMKRVSVLRNGKMKILDLTDIKFMQYVLEPNDSITVPQKRAWETK
jgi:polysaccharide export outer membrane protein